tara:strand:- start:58 stop:231 length:174 start_codon:yes stop_codon:yes gene_type:complete
MKIHASDMSDDEYRVSASQWREKHKQDLKDMEDELKKEKRQFATVDSKPWWKKILKI